MSDTRNNLELQSTLRPNGDVELALVEAPMPQPGEDEIVVEMMGAPLNPSDMSLLVALANADTAQRVEREGRSITLLQVPEMLVKTQSARVDQPLPIGNEGAGRVIGAGGHPDAQKLLGRMVGLWGGGTYARYKKVRVADCLALPEGVTAAQGAAAFINPLTALGMVETMRDEGASALVHTAAASNLGQMLCKLCQAEGIGLVNIVRNPKQAELLKSIGAEHVCDTSAPTFNEDLVTALRSTRATLGFDAIGGGRLAGQILGAMETAFKPSGNYSLYGSNVFKKVYIYGALEFGPVEVLRTFGSAWAMGGWLLYPFLERIGPDRGARLKQRVAAELTSTFSSSYSHVISLAEACEPEILRAATKRATGEKYLIDPSR